MSLASVIAFAAAIGMGGGFRRAIEVDELITLQYYTWAGVSRDGLPRELTTIEEVQRVGTPSLRQFVAGLYCSLGRWTEPNNHVPHSLLTGISMTAIGDSVVASRAVALVSATLFACALVVLCRRSGCAIAAPLAAPLSFSYPYVVDFSQTSRGYALMLLLTTSSIILAQQVARRPRSLAWCAAFVAVCLATFANTINLVVDWLFPLFALLVLRPTWFGAKRADGDASTYDVRRSLIAQGLALALAGAVFSFDRLPYVYSSMQQYGLAFSTRSEFLVLIASSYDALFPTLAWKCLSAVGVAGALLALSDGRMRGPVSVYFASAVVTLTHFAVAHRFSYVRNLGFLLPLPILGNLYLAEVVLRRFGPRWASACVAALLVATAAWFFGTAAVRNDRDAPLERLLSELATLASRSNNQPSLMLFGEGIPDNVASLYVHRDWSRSAAIANAVDAELTVYAVERESGFRRADGARGDAAAFEPRRWPDAAIEVDTGSYRIVRSTCRVVREGDFDDDAVEFAVIAWLPPFEAVSVTPAAVLESIERERLTYIQLNERYSAKMEVFSRLSCILVQCRGAGEISHAIDAIRRAREAFGGEILTLVPAYNE